MAKVELYNFYNIISTQSDITGAINSMITTITTECKTLYFPNSDISRFNDLSLNQKMKIKCLFLFSISILMFSSCSNKKQEGDITQQEPVAENTNLQLQDLTEFGIANFSNNVLGGLEVGDIAPDFKLENEMGENISLKESLKKGPVLLVFYRADWCPYCTKHLAEFEENINDIKENESASVIAISPQLPKYSKKLSEDNGYTFPILYDEDHVVMKDYKVFFRVTQEYNEKIFKFKGDYVQTRNGDTNPYLPVPATYVIGKDQRIKFVHYDPNYRNRANIEEALGKI